MDVNGQRGFVPEGQPVLSSVSALGGPGVSAGGVSPAMGVGGSSMFGQVKIDPYYLITKVSEEGELCIQALIIGVLPRLAPSRTTPRER